MYIFVYLNKRIWKGTNLQRSIAVLDVKVTERILEPLFRFSTVVSIERTICIKAKKGFQRSGSCMITCTTHGEVRIGVRPKKC